MSKSQCLHECLPTSLAHEHSTSVLRTATGGSAAGRRRLLSAVTHIVEPLSTLSAHVALLDHLLQEGRRGHKVLRDDAGVGIGLGFPSFGYVRCRVCSPSQLVE